MESWLLLRDLGGQPWCKARPKHPAQWFSHALILGNRCLSGSITALKAGVTHIKAALQQGQQGQQGQQCADLH
jgi:hypothetical protein